MAQLKITYTKSVIGYSKDQKATVKSLGLRKLNQSVIHNDTPVIRGMAFKVRHLVTLEEVNDASAATPVVRTSRTYAANPGTSGSSGSEQ
ncbi:MAG: 50S ribosomal protein L30 [Chloroflexota bacterium]|nr:50S ribosomal protein L30 [Chloroflexota bacterium]PLS80044.1 MAG: 50S ribosomal protein L30 [Chloroflexota bacterium]